jgi:predicted secreted protein
MGVEDLSMETTLKQPLSLVQAPEETLLKTPIGGKAEDSSEPSEEETASPPWRPSQESWEEALQALRMRVPRPTQHVWQRAIPHHSATTHPRYPEQPRTDSHNFYLSALTRLCIMIVFCLFLYLASDAFKSYLQSLTWASQNDEYMNKVRMKELGVKEQELTLAGEKADMDWRKDMARIQADENKHRETEETNREYIKTQGRLIEKSMEITTDTVETIEDKGYLSTTTKTVRTSRPLYEGRGGTLLLPNQHDRAQQANNHRYSDDEL